MPLHPADVDNKTFPLTNRLSQGYECGDVDQFLDEVKDSLVALQAENDELKRQLEVARAGGASDGAEAAIDGVPATREGGEQAALRLLQHAQRTADAALDEARQEADRVRADAERQQSELDADIAARREQQVAQVERERDGLVARVEALRAFEQESRGRLLGWFTEQARQLEQGDQPRVPPLDTAAAASSTGAPLSSAAAPSPLVPSSPAEPSGPEPRAPGSAG